ncbi:homeobox protein HOX1A-like [Zingiber officinale]|uniref:homeobox protein HOX1A-like n=1 Tax=Zingiber officinale TaxID=94328 RepID=UPI001C4CFF24|nr:homeobox protein HOX1A-like [Zingiber officinale]
MEQSSCKVDGKKTKDSLFKEKSNHQDKDSLVDAVKDDSREFHPADCEQDDDENTISASGAQNNVAKSNKKRKKASQTPWPSRYPLRSSVAGVRVLRSSSSAAKISNEQSIPASNSIKNERKRRKKRKEKSMLNNEFALIRKRIRYLLNRINYEQSLIDAYSHEGWKGQNLEKIRPEKELERAKSEILRCKLRIRESMCHLDSLLSEGRPDENMFDNDEIDYENIICATCDSKDLSTDNDIILCDGSCERGFHQKCLSPPLQTHEIPPGDQGWLCPACDCKVDCFNLLNEFQGSTLTIEDTWEKVFPEAAVIANGNNQLDDSNYPSDDSEDNDYDPDVEVAAEEKEEGSSSEEIDSTSLSEEDLESVGYNNVDVLGLPSDDSEDDDYDPECLDPNKDDQNEGPASNESDFTSDSDEFCLELSKRVNVDEVTSSQLDSRMADCSQEGRKATRKNTTNTRHPPMVEADFDNSCPVPKTRQQQRLDYEKLNDVSYGKASSDSSEDEEWKEKGKAVKVKKGKNKRESASLSYGRSYSVNHQRNLSIKDMVDVPPLAMLNPDQQQVLEPAEKSTPKTQQYLNEQHINDHLHAENGNKTTSTGKKSYAPHVNQRLEETFKQNQYPSQEVKGSLSKELGLTTTQIAKWFAKSRAKLRISATGLKLSDTVYHAETKVQISEGNGLGKSGSMNTESSTGNNMSSTSSEKNRKTSAIVHNTSSNFSRKNTTSSKGIAASDAANRSSKKTPTSVNKNLEVPFDREKALARELKRIKTVRELKGIKTGR